MAIQYSSQLDRTFRALGDATRREIVWQLTQTPERTASEFVSHFNSAQPTISKHLRVLEEAGLLERRVVGRLHKFSLVETPLNEAATWLHRHRAFWNHSLGELGAYLDEKEREDRS